MFLLKYSLHVFTVIITCSFELNVSGEKLNITNLSDMKSDCKFFLNVYIHHELSFSKEFFCFY